jgi:hypothetical protein
MLLVFFSSCEDPEVTSQSVKLAAHTSLSAGVWTHISAPEPLRTPGRDEHAICLTPVLPTRIDGVELLMEDGKGDEVTIQMVVAGPAGQNSLDLPSFIYRHGDFEFCLKMDPTQRLFSPYDEVRLWASSSIEIETLRWYSDTRYYWSEIAHEDSAPQEDSANDKFDELRTTGADDRQ